MRPVVRRRHAADLPALLVLLQRTHEQHGYPVRPAAVRTDWIASADQLGGWVADDGTVRGHVALQPASGAAVPLWRVGAGTDRLAVVSRLFTDGAVRGTGTALLAHAVAQAAARGRTAVLEVDMRSAALVFYRRRGWRDAGTCVAQWGSRAVEVAALVQPEA